MAEEEVFIRAARGTGALSLQSIVNSLLGLAFFMVFARMVSKAEMGVYGAALLVFSLLAIIGNLGLSFAAILQASLVELTLCLLLVPALSVIGAALSRALTYTAMLGLLAALSHKLIDISLDREALLKSGAASTTMALIVSSTAWTTNYKLTLLPLYLALGALTYLLLLTLSRALTPIDAELLKKPPKRTTNLQAPRKAR